VTDLEERHAALLCEWFYAQLRAHKGSLRHKRLLIEIEREKAEIERQLAEQRAAAQAGV